MAESFAGPVVLEAAHQGPASYYDTVEIQMPASAGTKVPVFRYCDYKHESLSNLTMACRLPRYHKLNARRLRAEITHWSGDDMTDALRRHASVTFSVAGRRLIECPLRDLLSPAGMLLDTKLDDEDTIEGAVLIESAPWPTPVEEEWEEVVETDTLSIRWPWWIKRVANRLDVPLPTLERSRTRWNTVSRPKNGSHLITVYIEGTGQKPIAY